MRPSVGFAAVRLLEAAGCEVVVPRAQTCCGQPAYNSGDTASAKALARQTMARIRRARLRRGAVGVVRGDAEVHYPRLMAGDGEAESAARAFAERVHELVSFLVDVRGLTAVPGSFTGRVTYHDGCRACANSRSASSRAGCWPPCRGSS